MTLPYLWKLVTIINQLTTNYFDIKHIYISTAKTRNEVFTEISQNLLKDGLVADEFLDKLIKREDHYSTGIDTNPIDLALPNVAMPHTEIGLVKTQLIVPVKLTYPISFRNMLIPKQELSVRFLFFILNNQGFSQVNFLSDIMDFIVNTDKNELYKFFNFEQKKDIYKFLVEHFRHK